MAYVSNELFHFVGRSLPTEDQQYRLLTEILDTGWLQSSYRAELGASGTMLVDPRNEPSTNETVRVPALCFCDIPFDSLSIHMEKYSRFGISFDREFLVSRGANPVFYVAVNAPPPSTPGRGPRTLGGQFNRLFHECIELQTRVHSFAFSRHSQQIGGHRVTYKYSPEGTPEELVICGKLGAIISDLESLVFARLKFFESWLPDNDKDNFYMEREWRKIGGLAFSPDEVTRLIVPSLYAEKLATDFPQYSQIIHSV